MSATAVAAPWLASALASADNAPSLSAAVAALRADLPGMRVMTMDALDLRDEKPAVSGTRRTLYLARSLGHCWSMTTDPDAASAVFVVDSPTKLG